MIYSLKKEETFTWNDEFYAICLFDGFQHRAFLLSKLRLLNSFSQFNNEDFEEFHIMILDNLSKLSRIQYINTSNEFTMFLTNSQIITTKISQKNFDDILIYSTVKQF